MNFRLYFFAFCLSINLCQSWIVDPGPVVKATQGEVWPKPQHQEKEDGYYILSASHFHFNIILHNCAILQEAKYRYTYIVLMEQKLMKEFAFNNTEDLKNTDKFIGYFKVLDVLLTEPCTDEEYPHIDMAESYTLIIPKHTNEQALLKAKSVWGILRGLETFSQIVYFYDGDSNLYLNPTKITDFPRFIHRGLLLDTARHYLTKDILLKNLDAMAYNKMNVFHWHIVDDQSFPYQSILYPELSDKGAYHPNREIYTPADVREIIEYARLRGIRVIPEFDSPGHARSWGISHPELLAQCYKNGKATSQYGPMNPSKESVFSFLDSFYGEIKSIFPDKYFHIGGDEVPSDCWKGNPGITDFMKKQHISDYKALHKYFIERVIDITSAKNISSIVWEEVYQAGLQIPEDTIVQLWRSDYKLLGKITAGKKKAIYSSCWYLDHLDSGGDWVRFYTCDPQDFNGSPDQLKLILGGEACMWAEAVDSYNVLQRVWPRASATAEVLWSAHKADTAEGAAKRLEEHVCRLNRRNIPAQPPNGAGYCIA